MVHEIVLSTKGTVTSVTLVRSSDATSVRDPMSFEIFQPCKRSSTVGTDEPIGFAFTLDGMFCEERFPDKHTVTFDAEVVRSKMALKLVRVLEPSLTFGAVVWLILTGGVDVG